MYSDRRHRGVNCHHGKCWSLLHRGPGTGHHEQA